MLFFMCDSLFYTMKSEIQMGNVGSKKMDGQIEIFPQLGGSGQINGEPEFRPEVNDWRLKLISRLTLLCETHTTGDSHYSEPNDV